VSDTANSAEVAPLTVSTIPEVIKRAQALFADDEAFVEPDQRLTYGQLIDQIHIAGAAFIASGIEPGDRVSIWAPNISEWAIAAFGLYLVGGVLVPLNTRYKGTEAGYVLDKASSKMLFTVTDFLSTDYVELLNSVERQDRLEDIVVMRGAVPNGAVSWSDFLDRAGHVDTMQVTMRANAVTPDDVSDILFTSGTTGSPKGAMLVHGASVRAFWAWAELVGLTAEDRYLIINPFFHSFGLKAGLLASLLKGCAMVPQPIFDVPDVMARVAAERISMIPGPPTIYQAMLNHPNLSEFDMTSLRLAVTGAASIPVELIYQMRERLDFERIVTAYGLTEATGIATVARSGDSPETIARTSGRAIPGVELKLVNQDGSLAAAGEPGELWLRGYNVMAGYLDNPEATEEAITQDGWLKTGDIAVMDDDGNLSITDRSKDMFIVGGFNAYPAEIENLLLRAPNVAQAAVIGVPDERLGEVPMAFVIPVAGKTATSEEIIDWARDNMANFKVPRRVEIVDAFPLNPSGKVLKYVLRDRVASGGSDSQK
jgi:acyl-CoA synthetase (AMP-forming)/AMP-acid ligase II